MGSKEILEFLKSSAPKIFGLKLLRASSAVVVVSRVSGVKFNSRVPEPWDVVLFPEELFVFAEPPCLILFTRARSLPALIETRLVLALQPV